MFLWRNKTNINTSWLIKASYLKLCIFPVFVIGSSSECFVPQKYHQVLWGCNRGAELLPCYRFVYLNFITKISPSKTESFQIKILIFFHISAQKIDCGYSLELPCRDGYNEYSKCPKISNTLKFRTPNFFAQNNFWKCPKISNSSRFAKRGFLKFRTQLSSSNFYRHILISVTFFFPLQNQELK